MNLFFARVILVIHFCWVAGMIVLGFWAAFQPPMLMIAAPLGIFNALVSAKNGCPFTDWEKRLLGTNAYKGTCIAHYVKQAFGVTIPQQLVPGIYTLCCVISLGRILFGV